MTLATRPREFVPITKPTRDNPGDAIGGTYTSLPETLAERQAKAEGYLDRFSQYTDYRHGEQNPYRKWLRTSPQLRPTFMYEFFNYWYPVSRHQPQILLQIASAYPAWSDRKLILKNYIEEDGMVKEGDDPHYVLLEQFIEKLGGRLDVDPDAEALVTRFQQSIVGMTAAEATGYVAAIEHPALDISDYFCQITRLAGRPELLDDDLYLSIHVQVEPNHIIWSHGNVLEWMQNSERQHLEGYSSIDVISAYQRAMSFWNEFWSLAFAKLGFRE